MAEVSRLEAVYLSTLTESERDTWDDHLDTRQPFDIKGTFYIVAEPTVWGATQVTPQRRFAWAQIYGTLRFNRAPILAVADLDEPDPVEIEAAWSSPTLSVTVTPGAAVSGQFQVLVWATQPRGYPQVSPQWQLRPIAALTSSRSPFTMDLTPNFSARWPIVANQITYLRAAAVNANNELCGLSEIQRLDFA